MKTRLNPWLLILMIVPMCFTGVAWWLVSQNQFQSVQAEFNHLTFASEKALQHRMDSYLQALLGGKGFFLGSSEVSREEWRQYTLALNITENFPGINGIGVINKVEAHNIDHYLGQVRAAGYSSFKSRPEGSHPGHYIINYIEPLESNREAVGLNIAFEAHRRQAADLAMATGQAAITQRILLVQDAEKTPGFLLLLPVPGNIVRLSGHENSIPSWVYAPFIAKNFMADLTRSQGADFRLEVYDEMVGDDTLIFDSHSGEDLQHTSSFVVEKQVEVMQQKWLLRWSSTEVFETTNLSQAPFFILIFGAFFTLLFSLFLILTAVHVSDPQDQRTQDIKDKKPYFVPFLIFIVASFASTLLYYQLADREIEQVNAHILKEQLTLDGALTDKINTYGDRLDDAALSWYQKGYGASNAQPTWWESVKAYNSDIDGLTALLYFNEELHLESSIEITTSQGASSVSHAMSLLGSLKNQIRKTPKARLLSNPVFFERKAFFLTVHPVIINERPVGYFVALYDLDVFISPTLTRLHIPDEYGLEIPIGEAVLSFGGKPRGKIYHGVIAVDSSKWSLNIWAKEQLIANTTSFLPIFVLLIGISVAVLMSMVVYFSKKVQLHARVIADKENLLSTFILNIPMSLAMFDHDFRYLTASERWFQLYDLDADTIIGRLHPESTSIIWRNQGLSSQSEDIVTLEEAVNHEDGSLKAWMRYRVCQWFKDNKVLGGVVVFAEDITEDKNMSLLKNEFVSTVSHELRTPLTAIQGALGLLKMGAENKLDEKYQKLLATSYDNCRNLTNIINDILDIEKVAAGELTYSFSEFELNELVQHVVDLNKPYAEKCLVNVGARFSENPLIIRADRNRLIQCLVNLLSNAAKFSHEYGQVYICLSVFNCWAKIEVEDFGEGIPLAFQSKIFQRFAQADGSSKRVNGGTGLGLAITKNMIDDMGGSIEFISAVGQGTTFSILMPLAIDAKLQGQGN